VMEPTTEPGLLTIPQFNAERPKTWWTLRRESRRERGSHSPASGTATAPNVSLDYSRDSGMRLPVSA
jgi:hypothetical protein